MPCIIDPERCLSFSLQPSWLSRSPLEWSTQYTPVTCLGVGELSLWMKDLSTQDSCHISMRWHRDSGDASPLNAETRTPAAAWELPALTVSCSLDRCQSFPWIETMDHRGLFCSVNIDSRVLLFSVELVIWLWLSVSTKVLHIPAMPLLLQPRLAVP
jgi:hypothetical protein